MLWKDALSLPTRPSLPPFTAAPPQLPPAPPAASGWPPPPSAAAPRQAGAPAAGRTQAHAGGVAGQGWAAQVAGSRQQRRDWQHAGCADDAWQRGWGRRCPSQAAFAGAQPSLQASAQPSHPAQHTRTCSASVRMAAAFCLCAASWASPSAALTILCSEEGARQHGAQADFRRRGSTQEMPAACPRPHLPQPRSYGCCCCCCCVAPIPAFPPLSPAPRQPPDPDLAAQAAGQAAHQGFVEGGGGEVDVLLHLARVQPGLLAQQVQVQEEAVRLGQVIRSFFALLIPAGSGRGLRL